MLGCGAILVRLRRRAAPLAFRVRNHERNMVPGRGREKGARSRARSYAPRLPDVPLTRPEEHTLLPPDVHAETPCVTQKCGNGCRKASARQPSRCAKLAADRRRGDQAVGKEPAHRWCA